MTTMITDTQEALGVDVGRNVERSDLVREIHSL